MIYGIGVDLVKVSRMEQILDRYGARFARRVLSVEEFDEFPHDPRSAGFLAKRFAAKEATAKAMGTGFRDGLVLAQIGVSHDRLGRPILRFTGRARELLEAWNITNSHLSLADEREYAVAFVTLERPNVGGLAES